MSAELELALPLIKQFEGCRLSAYRCPAGIPTIGWGRTQGVQLGDTCTQQQADAWLEEEVQNILHRLGQSIPHWQEMAPNQQAALASFAYNLGAGFCGAAGFETITRLLRDRQWGSVANTMLLYRNPGTEFEVGLARRRRAEGDLWKGVTMPPKPAPLLITARQATWLKKSAIQASALREDQKKLCPAGTELKLVWWKEAPMDRSHLQVSLDFEAGNWFLYAGHWSPWCEEAPKPSSTSHHDFSAAVSRYFSWGEVFQWDQRRITDSTEILGNIRRMALYLDALRDLWGGPLIVTSWYRDPHTNAIVGGVPNSQHLNGGATDLYPADGRAKAFEDFCVQYWEYGGIGKGVSSGRGFVHLDCRGQKVVWLY